MSNVYGFEGSFTYAVELSGLDELMDVLPDNNINQISAQQVRNVAYTLWLNGGGEGGSFFYTQTAPLSQGSVDRIGGIPSGSTFSNVPLQELLDRIFFPPQGTLLSISLSDNSFELGYGVGSTPPFVPTVTVSPSVTKKNPTITSVSVTDTTGLNTYPSTQFPKVSLGSLSFGQTITPDPPFTGKIVTQDTSTVFTLTVNDGGPPKTAVARVDWYFPRWLGSVDLSGIVTFTDMKLLLPSDKLAILSRLKSHPTNGKQDWSPVWGASRPTFCSFTPYSSQISGAVSISPINTAGSFMVLIFLKSDYGGDGRPSNYLFGPIGGEPFVELGDNITIENRFGRTNTARIWIKDFPIQRTSTFTINA